MRRLFVAALLSASIAGAQPNAPQISPSWLPDTFVFLGNTVRGRQPGRLLTGLNLLYKGKFGIAMAVSDDDGRSWHFGGIVDSDLAHDFWDPTLARLPDSSLLLEHHGYGGMTMMRSTDDGATWRRLVVFPGGDVEGYFQPLPGRLAMLYGNSVNHVTEYRLRTTTDGAHWTDPVPISVGGATWDALRGGLGPVVPESGGIMHVVSAYRAVNSDSESIQVLTIDAHTFKPRGAPTVIYRYQHSLKGQTFYPIPAECPDGLHVITSPRYGNRTTLEEIVVHHDGTASPPRPFVERGPMVTGWGRAWFVPSWSGVPQISWVELPNGPHSRLYSIPRPDLAHCAY